MRLAIVAVVVLAVLAVAEEYPGLGKDKAPAPQGQEQAQVPVTTVSSRSRSSSSGSSGSSSGSPVDPKKVAKEMITVLDDADGSAFFKGNVIQADSVAEVPPKKKLPPRDSRGRFQPTTFKDKVKNDMQKIKSKLFGGAQGPASRGSRGSGSRSSGSRSRSSGSSSASLTSRQKRPLFNFKNVPAGVNGVGLRKHSFRTKHHQLISQFVNKNPKVTLVIVVDTFIGPKGRASKKRDDPRRRGSLPSEVRLKNIKHKNLFIFDEKGKQLYPNNLSSSSSSSGSSRRRATPGPRNSQKPPSFMDKVKNTLKDPFGKKKKANTK